jgi:hypothetical protein
LVYSVSLRPFELNSPRLLRFIEDDRPRRERVELERRPELFEELRRERELVLAIMRLLDLQRSTFRRD